MKPLKDLPLRLGQKMVRAWDLLSEGWRELLTRSSGALTYFDTTPEETSRDGEG
jgi:hypothetical protein